MPQRVLGIDGWRGGWVAVVLEDGRFGEARVATELAPMLDSIPIPAAIGVDMAIGLPEAAPRDADLAAKRYLGVRRASVFLIPPRAVLEEPDYAAARATARNTWGRGVTAQAFALRAKILEVDALSQAHSLAEIHPEVSFRTMAASELGFAKRTWAGQQQRTRLLAEHGIVLPEDLGPASRVPVDDVLDAAAVAWSARRIARGEARHLPEAADPDREPVIWY